MSKGNAGAGWTWLVAGLLLSGCAGDAPTAPSGAVGDEPLAGVSASSQAPAFSPGRFVVFHARYYAALGEIRYCQAVPPPEIPVSDFLLTFPNGNKLIHMNGTDAYVMVSDVPASLDSDGALIVPAFDDFEARWVGRGHLTVRAWLGPGGVNGPYSKNWTVDAVVGAAEAVGITHGPIQARVRDHAAAFDDAIADGEGLQRVRCRLHTNDFLGKVLSNDITVEPLRGNPGGKGWP